MSIVTAESVIVFSRAATTLPMNRQFLPAAVAHYRAEIKARLANVEAIVALGGVASHLDPKILLAVVQIVQTGLDAAPSHERLVGYEQVSA